MGVPALLLALRLACRLSVHSAKYSTYFCSEKWEEVSETIYTSLNVAKKVHKLPLKCYVIHKNFVTHTIIATIIPEYL